MAQSRTCAYLPPIHWASHDAAVLTSLLASEYGAGEVCQRSFDYAQPAMIPHGAKYPERLGTQNWSRLSADFLTSIADSARRSSSTPIPKKRAFMELQIRCSVNPGQFSSEYAVIVQAFNGKTYSLFASRQDVECDFPPTEDQSVEGWLSVQPIKHNNKLFLVQLPQSTLENGRFISVSSDQLKSLPGARTA
jgi:hypothetical protein